ncbi:MAG: hypothetical protein CVT73_05425 [Alphaproteobacteria bacterium HGW-Alphaproteobacteria-12]|nr:MAG: hypothetical protein CVT73_05425 [Alphaproteobacteria bacterium HGW-Alphaproteobacteria-12]
MSITDLIADRVTRNMLFPVLPKARGAARARAMFVAQKLWDVLNSPEGNDEAWEQRVGELQADLERFVGDDPVTPEYLKLLYPAVEGVWEIRSVTHKPSIRVLGLFPEKDVFVATNMELRENLGGWQSRAWKDVKRLAKTVWVWLFHTYPPIITIDIKQLVSGAVDGKYFKG